MSKEEIIQELYKLKKGANEYSGYALMNEGYRVAIMDAIDLVKKLDIDKCNGCEESTGETKLLCCNHCGKRIEEF